MGRVQGRCMYMRGDVNERCDKHIGEQKETKRVKTKQSEWKRSERKGNERE